MKSHIAASVPPGPRSPPSRGAWIEIITLLKNGVVMTSPPSRGAWIEMPRLVSKAAIKSRRPPRGGRGLKCAAGKGSKSGKGVAPLAGGVD